MTLRRLKYRFMKGEKLIERAEKNIKKLENAYGINEIVELCDDNYDIVVSLIRKGRHNSKFIHYIKENIGRLYR